MRKSMSMTDRHPTFTSSNDEPSQSARISIFCSCFLLLYCFGIWCADGRLMLYAAFDSPEFQRGTLTDDQLAGWGVTNVRSIADWERMMRLPQCTLFIDCNWNSSVVAQRKPYAAFAYWCRNQTHNVPVRVILDTNDETKICDVVERFQERNFIPGGGMKNQSGAGRVIWLKFGIVRDFDWIERIESASVLERRTRRVFDQSPWTKS